MNQQQEKVMERIKALCGDAGIDVVEFLEDVETQLKNSVKQYFTPNTDWFHEGKSIDRYWKFLEELTAHQWEYQHIDHWYKFLRDPSDTREAITASLRYKVMVHDKSTCQKCGRKAPEVELEIDHILPWNCGGPTVIRNLQTLCKDCNIGKSDLCFEGAS